MTNHTPSTWHCSGSTDCGNFVVWNDDCGDHSVIEIKHGMINSADIDLIVSAPDLLDALTDLFNDVMYLGFADECNDSFQKASRAITKATGSIL